MITLTKRQKDISLYLLKQNDYLTGRQLAEHFSVSIRTIRNDLDQIEAYLKERQLLIVRKSGIGVRIFIDAQKRMELKQMLEASDGHYLNKEERHALILTLLLIHDSCTFQELGEACQVSRQTIINSFAEIEAIIKKNALHITKQQGVGISLSGDERALRQLFLQMVNEYPLIVSNAVPLQLASERYDSVISQMIREIEHAHSIRFVNKNRLTLLLTFFLWRMEQGHCLKRAKRLQKQEEELFHTLTPYISAKAERAYISTIMLSERMQQDHASETIYDDAYLISHELLDALKKLHHIDELEDEEMIRGLTIHIRSAIYRIRNHIAIRNELLEEIKLSISLIYAFTRKQLSLMETRFHIHFNEHETAYIAMYIASIYERNIKASTTLHILLVCSFGLASSAILKTRIEQTLAECHVDGPMSKAEAEIFLSRQKVDLIISTNTYEQNDIPVLVVNPLLSASDIEKIKNRLFQDSYSKMCDHFIKSSESSEIAKIPHAISDYIEKDAIQVIERCESWEKAIALAAAPLLAKQAIEQRYVNAMIDAVKNYGTYMVLTPGCAYVHAGIHDGIKENCTALLTMHQPLLFGDHNAKSVHTIVVLGIHDKEDNDLLNLAYILEKERNIKALCAKDVDVQAILSMHD